MAKRVWLEAEPLKTRSAMGPYLAECFDLDEVPTNLDALHDELTEVCEHVNVYMTQDTVKEIASDEYAYKVLMVLGDAVTENPYIKLRFKHNIPRQFEK